MSKLNGIYIVIKLKNKKALIEYSADDNKADVELLKALEASIKETDKQWTDKLTKE